LLRAWHIRQLLKAYARLFKPENILDAGSGFGQYTYRLNRLFPEANILAVDLNRELVDASNLFFKKIGKINVHFETADLTQFHRNEEFELALCIDVLEHIKEDEKVFANLYHALKEGGWLLISTPSDRGGSDVKCPQDSSFIEEHVRSGYSALDIEKKLRQAGFSHVEVRYSYGLPGQISWKLSMKYPLLLLNFHRIFFLLLPLWYLFAFPVCLALNFLDVRMQHPTGTGLIVKAVR
jgi:SAM-dependent methyltransferase